MMPVTPDHSTSIEHQNVPQAHCGLHDFLYNSEEEHSLTASETSAIEINSESAVTTLHSLAV